MGQHPGVFRQGKLHVLGYDAVGGGDVVDAILADADVAHHGGVTQSVNRGSVGHAVAAEQGHRFVAAHRCFGPDNGVVGIAGGGFQHLTLNGVAGIRFAGGIADLAVLFQDPDPDLGHAVLPVTGYNMPVGQENVGILSAFPHGKAGAGPAAPVIAVAAPGINLGHTLFGLCQHLREVLGGGGQGEHRKQQDRRQQEGLNPFS